MGVPVRAAERREHCSGATCDAATGEMERGSCSYRAPGCRRTRRRLQARRAEGGAISRVGGSMIFTSVCSPNEDFGRPNEPLGTSVRMIYQTGVAQNESYNSKEHYENTFPAVRYYARSSNIFVWMEHKKCASSFVHGSKILK